jgi:hypothetical protein
MNGIGDNMFSPQNPYTREQSICTIMRMYGFVYAATGVAPVSELPNSLPATQSLRKGMTDTEFDQAFEAAYNIMRSYAGVSREEQVEAVFNELSYIRHRSAWEYSMTDAHYNDAYGFFMLHRTSCAGDVRAAGLCLTILGIPYEHINENQYGHQWVRLEVEGVFVVLDVNAPFIGFELTPYRHPLIG